MLIARHEVRYFLSDSLVDVSGPLGWQGNPSLLFRIRNDKAEAEGINELPIYYRGTPRGESDVGVCCNLPVTRGLPNGFFPFSELQLHSNDFLAIAPLRKKHVNSLEPKRNFGFAEVLFRREQFLHWDPQFIFSERQ
jgi:hypothetical protein